MYSYKQSLWAAQHAYKLFKASNIPFTRPSDYYAEMLKTDDHMEKIRQKLLDESAGIKASEAAKKQRSLKKFGKQVQVERTRKSSHSRRVSHSPLHVLWFCTLTDDYVADLQRESQIPEQTTVKISISTLTIPPLGPTSVPKPPTPAVEEEDAARLEISEMLNSEDRLLVDGRRKTIESR